MLSVALSNVRTAWAGSALPPSLPSEPCTPLMESGWTHGPDGSSLTLRVFEFTLHGNAGLDRGGLGELNCLVEKAGVA